MIIYTNTDERLVPAQLNMITLQVDKGGYIYIDRVTYVQAAILMDKYMDDWDGLCSMVNSTSHTAEVNFLKETLPEPLNYLAPFISLIDEKKEFDGTLEQLVGCLHVISKNINFDKILRIPAEIRRSVSFSGHITAEYELQWDEFKNECIPYASLADIFTGKGTSSSKPRVSSKPRNAEPVTITLANPDDAALSDMSQEEIEDLCAEVDMDDIDWEAEMKKLEEEDAKKAGASTTSSTFTQSLSSASPASEAESGKTLLDEWGDL